MYTLILIVHFICCVVLILLILMQSGKGSAAGIFGGGGGDNLFASPTAFNMVNRVTAVIALIIFITSISLTMLANRRGVTSAADNIKIPPVSAPATPGPAAPAHK